MQLTRAEALGYDVSRFAHGMCVGPSPGRDRVLAIRRDRNRRRVLIPDENTQLGGGASSRRAGTRALP